MKAKKNNQAESFVKGASLQEGTGSREEYPDAISVRMTKDMADTIRAIAYYERISQREVVTEAIDLLLKEKDPNEIKEAIRVYNKSK